MKTKLMRKLDGSFVEVDINTPCEYVNNECVELSLKTVKEIADITLQNITNDIKLKRNELLFGTDYLMIGDHPKMQDPVRVQELKSYRQALRDLTKQVTSPDSEVIFPTKPSWI